VSPTRIALFTALAFAAAACSRPGRDDDFKWATQLPAGAVLHLRDGNGDIQVTRSADQTARVNGSKTWHHGRADDVRFVVKQRGNDFYVCAMWSGSGNCGQGNYRGPGSRGFLAMFSLFHRRTDARADIAAEIPANVAVDARNINGSVELDGAAAGVKASTVNGDVRATGVSGPLDMSSTNGDVRVSTTALSATDPIDLSTVNGSVHAELPAAIQGAFDISTVNGSATSNLPVPSVSRGPVGRHLQGQIGESSRPIRLHSVNGTVDLTTR
jgi:hypothetical protein